MFHTNVVEKIKIKKKHFLCSITVFRKSSLYEIMWKDTVQSDKAQMTIWGMCIACWKTKAKNTHSDYVILIAFPLQLWLHDHSLTVTHK